MGQGKIQIGIVFCFFFGVLTQSFSQGYFLGGYSTSTVQANSINEIIERYNANEDWIEDEMEQIKSLQGVALGVGKHFSRFNVDLIYSNKNTETSSFGFDSTGSLKESLKFRSNNLVFGLSAYPFIKKVFVLGLGASFDISFVQTLIQSYNSNKFKSATNYLGLSNHFFIDFKLGTENMPFAIGIRPYYQYYWQDENYYSVEQKLDSQNANSLDENDFKEKPNSLGIMLSLIIYPKGKGIKRSIIPVVN